MYDMYGTGARPFARVIMDCRVYGAGLHTHFTYLAKKTFNLLHTYMYPYVLYMDEERETGPDSPK